MALVVVATCLAYAPAFRAPYELDDIASIQENPTIRSVWPPAAPLRTPPGIAVSGRPVVNYSLALNYAINERLGVDQRPDPDGGDKTLGFHLANLLIHLLSGALLFGITRRTLSSPSVGAEWPDVAHPIAAVVTSLWLLHPIQTEAVNYVIQRTELIVSACYLGTLYASIRAWEAEERGAMVGWYAIAVAASLLGMGSKEVMISAPVMVLLYDRAFRSSSWREVATERHGRIFFYLALLATSTWSIALIAAGSRAETVGFNLGLSWYRYLDSQAWAIAHYLRLVFWPDQLTFDYGQEPIAALRTIPGVLLVMMLGAATLAAWARRPALGFVGAWFFLILAPSSSFVPIRTEIAAERRFYLPLAAVLVALAVGLTLLRRRAGAAGRARWWHPLVAGDPTWKVALLCVLLAATTFARSRTYADPVALWRDSVAKSPRNPRGFDNLAAALLHQDPPLVADAEAALRQAIAIDSSYLPAWPDLAAVVAEQGRLAEARQLLERALVINPDYVRAVERLGGLLVVMGQPAAALPYLERVASEHANDEPLVALGTAYMALDRPDDAVRTLRRALDLNPARADARMYVGSMLTDQGHATEALPYLEEAVRLEPGSGYALAVLSLAYAQTGRPTDAASAAGRARASGSSDPNVYLLAGRAMLVLHRAKEAEEYFRHALAMQPNFEPARRALEEIQRQRAR